MYYFFYFYNLSYTNRVKPSTVLHTAYTVCTIGTIYTRNMAKIYRSVSSPCREHAWAFHPSNINYEKIKLIPSFRYYDSLGLHIYHTPDKDACKEKRENYIHLSPSRSYIHMKFDGNIRQILMHVRYNCGRPGRQW